MTSKNIIAISVTLILVGGPSLLGLKGLICARRARADGYPDLVRQWDWKLTITSALLYTLAFKRHQCR